MNRKKKGYIRKEDTFFRVRVGWIGPVRDTCCKRCAAILREVSWTHMSGRSGRYPIPESRVNYYSKSGFWAHKSKLHWKRCEMLKTMTEGAH